LDLNGAGFLSGLFLFQSAYLGLRKISPMKPLLLGLIIAGFIFSCKNSKSDKKAEGSDLKDSTAAGTSPRRAMIIAINDLKAALESKDKNRIAGYFDFPIPDTVMSLYLDDSTFMEIYRSSGDQLTRKVFLEYYDTISRFTSLTDIMDLFEYVPVDSLLYKDDLEKEVVNKKEPCIPYHGISVEGESVTFRVGTYSNKDYESPK
jgi:hypothetical protein